LFGQTSGRLSVQFIMKSQITVAEFFALLFARSPAPGVLVVASALVAASASANGIYHNGSGARAMALGGAGTVVEDDPLSAMAANPASLTTVAGPAFSLGAVGLIAEGKFSNAANPSGVDLGTSAGFGGELALSIPLCSRATIGFGFTPESTLRAEWAYNDTNPGATGNALVPGGVSYGFQKQESEIIVLRTALGLGVKITEALSVGASVGLLYNDNRLTAPYVFQSHPGLAGLKTLLDLSAEGLGFDGQIGALWRPTPGWSFAVAWKSPSVVHAKGNANGDAGTQLGAPSVPFHYDAEVQNHFPQTVSLGTAWKPAERWRLLGQIDWINWSDAFDVLRVRLSNGDNSTINGVLGTTSLNDDAPLRWRDAYVFRTGAEYDLTHSITLRAGYSYGRSPVPDETLTPLTAVILEHTIGLGAGWHRGRWQVDAAWQWDLPTTRDVGTSALQAGEYSNSSVKAGIHTFALTGTVRF
jgi:long-chain fatty acid transport protein